MKRPKCQLTMVGWQSVNAIDCKPIIGRLDSYPDLQVSKLDVGIEKSNESLVTNASELALVYRECK